MHYSSCHSSWCFSELLNGCKQFPNLHNALQSASSRWIKYHADCHLGLVCRVFANCKSWNFDCCIFPWISSRPGSCHCNRRRNWRCVACDFISWRCWICSALDFHVCCHRVATVLDDSGKFTGRSFCSPANVRNEQKRRAVRGPLAPRGQR